MGLFFKLKRFWTFKGSTKKSDDFYKFTVFVWCLLKVQNIKSFRKLLLITGCKVRRK